MIVQGRPVAALKRRIAALETKRRERVLAEIDALWERWSAHNFGLTARDFRIHQRELGTHAAAQLGVEAGDLLELLRVLGIVPPVGTAEEVEAAGEQLNDAVRGAARETFRWRSGRPYLRQDGESGEPAPFDRNGWRSWDDAHPGLAKRFLRLRVELRRLKS